MKTITSPAQTASDAATDVHNFIYHLNALMNAGASSDEVWKYCIENGRKAKTNLAIALNYYEGRVGARELSTD